MIFDPSREAESRGDSSQNKGLRWLLLVAFAVFASLGFLVAYALFLVPVEPMGEHHPAVGSALRSLQLEPFVDAEQAVTHRDLKGNVTLINYWGPWCPPCRIEMPHIAEIEREHRRHGQFRLLSVVCGAWAYPSLDAMRIETEEYRGRAKLDFPIYYDPDFKSRTELETVMGKEAGMMSYPTTVIVDQRGSIAGVWAGYSADVPAQIRAAIDRLIAER